MLGRQAGARLELMMQRKALDQALAEKKEPRRATCQRRAVPRLHEMPVRS